MTEEQIMAHNARLRDLGDRWVDPGPIDPVEVTIPGETKLLFKGTFSVGEYDVFVGHEYYFGIPGQDECLGLSRSSVCDASVASASALLMRNYDLQMVRW